MPLLERARIEIYLPGGAAYGRLQTIFEREFLYTFGGCTVVPETKGLYLAADGTRETEGINLVYVDTTFDLSSEMNEVEAYTEKLKSAVLDVTNEESVLIVVHRIYHSI